ncbi:integrase core domain-containing protein [Kosakonia pseudosacchari]
MELNRVRLQIGCAYNYNQRRPHSALGWMTPSEFAEKSAGCQNMQPD